METPIVHPGEPPDGLGGGDNYSVTLRFLDFIFAGFTAGFVEFRYLTAGRKQKAAGSPVYQTLPLEPPRVISEVLAHQARQAIAFGPAPRRRIPARRARGQDHDVLEVGCVWASVEHRRVEGGLIGVMRRIQELPLRPSVVVEAVPAHHVYFVLNDALQGRTLLEWSDLMALLGSVLRLGGGGSISGVLTLPGTVAYGEEFPTSSKIIEEDSSWTRYSAEEVQEALRSALTASRASSGSTNQPWPVDELRRRGLDAEVIETIITGRMPSVAGAAAGNPGRHWRDFWVASTLLKNGFSAEEVKAVFRAHPHGCGDAWARKRRGDKYLDDTLRKVIDREEDRREIEGIGRAFGDEDVDTPSGGELPLGYVLGDDGALWFTPRVTDDARKSPKPVKVSNSVLRITELQEDVDTGRISAVISYDYLGRPRSASILRSQMSDSRQLVAALAGGGAPVSSTNARLVLMYLAAYEHAFGPRLPLKRVTSRFGRGRAGGPFFLPGLASAVEFKPQGAGDAALFRAYSSREGSLGGWLEAMRALADDALMIPQVTVLAAFIPPLQRKLRIPNFILDLHGHTSTGKSTSLKLSASVYGRPHDPDSLVLQWTNTRVAVEQVAAMCSELPVYLDDAQHCAAELKRSVIYMIANGRGKGRGARGGGVSETPTWHTVAISTSEEPLYESSPHEGARGRILPMGGINPPFRHGSASLVRSLEKAAAANHGHAGEIFIRHLNGLTELDWLRWQRRYAAVRDDLARSSSSDLAGRVSGYIAAIQVAAEAACPLLGLRFKPEVVAAWLMLHLQEQQSDQNLVLIALRAMADFYIANIRRFAGDGQYGADKRGTILGSSKRHQYVGFLRATVDLIFKPHKWNQNAVLGKLAETGVICSTEKDRYTKKVSVEGVNHRMVCIKWSALLPEDIHS